MCNQQQDCEFTLGEIELEHNYFASTTARMFSRRKLQPSNKRCELLHDFRIYEEGEGVQQKKLFEKHVLRIAVEEPAEVFE